MSVEITNKSKVGDFLKCQNPENQLSSNEFEVTLQAYQNVIKNRIWQSQHIPSSKKGKSVLDCQFIMKYILSNSDRSFFCPATLQAISQATGISHYKTRQLLFALEEMNLLVYNHRGVQLRTLPKSTETISELYNRIILKNNPSLV